MPDPVPEEGNPSQHDTRGNQVLGPTRGKPKLAVGRTKNGPRSEPIAGPRGREQRGRSIQQSAASRNCASTASDFPSRASFSREMGAVSRVRARSIARPASGEPEMGGSGVAAPPSCDIGARWCGPAVHRRHRTADAAANDAVTIAGPLPSSSSVASAAGRPTPLAVEIRPRGASGIPAAQYGGARTAAWSGSSGTLARREGKMSQRRGRGRKKRSCAVTEHFRPAAAPMTKQRGTVRAGKCVCVCCCCC